MLLTALGGKKLQMRKKIVKKGGPYPRVPVVGICKLLQSREEVGIPLTGSTLSHLCAGLKPGSEFQTYVVIVFVFSEFS